VTFRLRCLGEPAIVQSAPAATPTVATSATNPGRWAQSVAVVADVAVATHAALNDACRNECPPEGACDSCWHFRPAPGEAPDGRCARYGGDAWSALTGGCCGGWESRDPAARELERRRASVADRLRADLALRYAFDVTDVPPAGRPAGPVSMMLGLRDRDGRIITGELQIPAEKWDMTAFLAYWGAQGRPS
jgi:hypothetical protein